MAEQPPPCGEGTLAGSLQDSIPPHLSITELSLPAPAIQLQELSPPSPVPSIQELSPPAPSMQELSPASPSPALSIQELSPPAPPMQELSAAPPSPAPSMQELSPAPPSPAPSMQELSPAPPSPAPSIQELSPPAPSIAQLSPTPTPIQEPYPNTSAIQEQSTTGLSIEPLTALAIQKEPLNNSTTTLPALGPQEGVTVKNQAFYVRLTPETKQASIYPEIELPPGTKQVVIYPKAPHPPPVTSLPLSTQPVTSQPLITQPVTSLPLASKSVTLLPLGTQLVTSQPLVSQPVTSLPLGATSVTSLPLGKQPMTSLLRGNCMMPLPLSTQPVAFLPHGGQKVTQLQHLRQPIVLLPLGGTQMISSLQGPQVVKICPKTSLPVGIFPQPQMDRELRIFPRSKKVVHQAAKQIKVIKLPPKTSTPNPMPSEEMATTPAQVSLPEKVQIVRTFHKTLKGRELRILPEKTVHPPPRQVKICSQSSLQPGQEEILCPTMSESQGLALHAAAWASEVSEVPGTMVVDRGKGATQEPAVEISESEGEVHTSVGLTGEDLILSILTGQNVAQSGSKSGDLRSPLQLSSKSNQVLDSSHEPVFGGNSLTGTSKVIGFQSATNAAIPCNRSRKLLTKDDLCSLNLSAFNVGNVVTSSTDLNADSIVRTVQPIAGIPDKGETTGSDDDITIIDQISIQKEGKVNPKEQLSEHKDILARVSDVEEKSSNQVSVSSKYEDDPSLMSDLEDKNPSDLVHESSENEDDIAPVSVHEDKNTSQEHESSKYLEDMAPVFEKENGGNIPPPDSTSSEVVEDLARTCSQQKFKKAVMLFVCSECDMEFTESALCERHIEGHSIQTYDCTQCGEGLNSNAELSQHMIAEHSQTDEIDYAAYKRKPDRQQNNIQVGSVTTTEARVGVATTTEPQVATSTTNEPAERKTQYRRQPRGVKRRRQISNYEDNDEDAGIMKDTRKSETLQPKRMDKASDCKYRCKLCGKGYKLNIALTVHLCRHANPPPRRTYPCQECGKVYKTMIGLKGHRATHTKQYLHQCSRCPLGFAFKSKLDRHMKGHEQVRPYKCSVCQKGFTQSADVTRHMRGHTGEKPFQCPRCKKWYRDKGSVTEHLARPHCNLRGLTVLPETCHVCSKSFRTTKLLKIHLYKVHQEGDLEPAPFICDICGKGVWSKQNLDKHVARHSRETQSRQRQVFPCEVCLDAFLSKAALTRHIKNFHGKTGEEPAASDINTGEELSSAIDSINSIDQAPTDGLCSDDK